MEATKELFAARIQSMNPPEAVEAMQNWVYQVSDVYGIDAPTVRWTSASEAHGSGCYVPSTHEIRMPKASLMTLMHEFRHAHQHRGAEMVESTHGDIQIEEDARSWSMSLFAKVAPKRFRRLALEGKIFHVEPETLAAFAERANADS